MATIQRLHEDSGSGTDSDLEDDGQVRKGGKKRPRGGKAMQPQKRMRQDADVAVTLFEVVRQGKMAMTAIVDDWIEAYKADRNEALLDLIQFFINASGCKGTVTAEMLRDASEGFQDVIKRMTEEFDEDSGDYPLIASGINFKKFRNNFSDFVQALVRQCQYQIIYDQFMMDNVLTLLTELSNSQVRAFRHTSTLAAMKLMTALVNVALALSVNLDNTQRQYEAERGKAANKRATEKLDILLEKRKDLEDQQTEIESMLNGIFKGIFVHRYRDYLADIRALCMEEIGVWMKMFPKVFLTDSYLKYVGWTLHDKQKEVRMKCLQTLNGLYQNEDMTKDLKLFTSRFKDRIVSMTLDKEYDVAVFAIKLLILILDHCGYDSPVLSSNDAESVYQLVYSVYRPVAVAAAEFLNKQLFSHKETTPGYTKRGRRRSPNAPVLTDLVLFFIESELHEHATYLVDSLWEVASGMLKDWDCMTDLLLEEPANDRDQLDTRQESVLVDIMVCSVKQAAEGAPPTGRQGHSKKVAVRDRRTVIEDRVKLTEHFIVTLPSLLNKYQVDKEKVTMLLQIPRYFDLELYTSSRLEKHLEMLLKQMAVIVEKHTDTDLLEQASMTYRSLCDNDYTMASKAQVERQTVIDSWAENFNLALEIFKDAVADATTGADDEEVYNVVQTLKRLTRLYMHNDVSSCNLGTPVSSILKMYTEKPAILPDDMLEQALRFVHCDLMYTFALLKEKDQDGQFGLQEHKDELQRLRQSAIEYMAISEHILSHSIQPKVKEACYMAVCDLIIIFSPQLAHSSPNLEALVLRPSDALQHHLVDFVKSYVFIVPSGDEDDEEDTAKIESLHHRRLLLAAICKLFIHSMIEMRLAATVFQQYIRCYTDYGDIIKETISRTRHINKMACAQTIGLCLMTLFRDTLRRQGGKIDHSSAEYGHMKELARRLSLTFGLDQVKNRDAVAALHKEGIIFALKHGEEYINDNVPPENLSFLSVLCEFSSKLMRQDRKTVVNYLDKNIKPQMIKQQTAGWIPLVTYRNSLMQGAAEELDTAKNFSKARGRQRRKKGDLDGDGPRTPMTPATPMSPAPMTPMNPQHASTAQRDVVQQRPIRRDDMGYQQVKKKRLESWLATARYPSRQPSSHRRNSSLSKGSILSSIFESDQGSDKVQAISEQMRTVEIKNSRKRQEYESFSSDENIKINRKYDESSLEDIIEDFTDDEADLSDKRNNLPDLDEEVIKGFDHNGFISGDVDSQGVNEQLSQDTDYYRDSVNQPDQNDDEINIQKKKKLTKNANHGKQREKDGSTRKSKGVKNDNGKQNIEASRGRLNDSQSTGDDDVFYDALPDIKTKKDASSAAEKVTPRYATRGQKRNFSYRETSDSSDDDTLTETPTRQVFDENMLKTTETTESMKKQAKKAKTAILQKNSPIRKNSPKSKDAPKKLEQTTDSTFLSDILEKIAQASQSDVTIDDVTIDEDVLGMWEDAKDVMESDGNKNSPRFKSFGFSQIVKQAKANASSKPSTSKGKNSKFDLRLTKTNNTNKTSKAFYSKPKTSHCQDVTDTTFESDTDVFSDISDANELDSATSNPFSKITRAFGKDVSMSGGGDARVFSDDTASITSDTDKATQKSTATARTHISDVDVVDLLLNDGDETDVGGKMATEKFGAFANVVRDMHSQRGQKMSTGFSRANVDDFLSDDDSDSSDTFAKVFASPKKDNYLSPLSTDDEDDNFARMFGFKTGKNNKKKRQPNLMGGALQSPTHPMPSPMHTGYHQPAYHSQMPGTPQPAQQQYVVPGQQMMYQQQGYQMQMQSPMQHNMQGQQQFYGN